MKLKSFTEQGGVVFEDTAALGSNTNCHALIITVPKGHHIPVELVSSTVLEQSSEAR